MDCQLYKHTTCETNSAAKCGCLLVLLYNLHTAGSVGPTALTSMADHDGCCNVGINKEWHHHLIRGLMLPRLQKDHRRMLVLRRTMLADAVWRSLDLAGMQQLLHNHAAQLLLLSCIHVRLLLRKCICSMCLRDILCMRCTAASNCLLCCCSAMALCCLWSWFTYVP